MVFPPRKSAFSERSRAEAAAAGGRVDVALVSHIQGRSIRANTLQTQLSNAAVLLPCHPLALY
jgi:hypothetical protein